MKGPLIENFYRIFDWYQPANICEIGTHSGKSAYQMCRYLLEKGIDVNYVGYDAFELADESNHVKEHNGKGHGQMHIARQKLGSLKEKYPNFKYKLVKGFTQDTLVKKQKYDFAFIDGGHSYETVKHDYTMLEETPVIIFDDYQIEGVAQFVNELRDTYEIDTKCPRGKRKQAARIKDFAPAKDHLHVGVFKGNALGLGDLI